MLLGKHLSDEEAAEKLMRHRARIMPFIILVFAIMQVLTFIKIYQTGYLNRAGWYGWGMVAFVMLNVVSTGALGFAARYGGIRTYIDDELTRSHRYKAFTSGFGAVMSGAVALLIASAWIALNAQLVLHSLIGFGTIVTTTHYIVLERRALKS